MCESQIGDAITLNTAIYYIEWDDIRVDDVTENGDLPIQTNGGTAESMGLEISGSFQITPAFSINGSYSYNKAELTEDAAGIVDGEDGIDGDRLPGSPEHQVYLAANYLCALTDGSELNWDWNMVAQSDCLHQGRQPQQR